MKVSLANLFAGMRCESARRLWRRPAAVFIVALLVRVIYVLVIDGWYELDVGDQAAYDRIAREWVANGQFMPGSSYRPPAYPAFVASVYRLCGPHREAVELVQAVLGAFTVLLVVQLGRRLFTLRAAAVAGWVTALLPVLVHFTAQLMAETLFTLLLLLLLWLVVRHEARQGVWSVAGTGLLIGAGALMRPNVLLLPLALACWWRWGCGLPVRKALKNSALCMAIAMLTILPWSLRNLGVQGAFVPISTNGGVNLWIGNNEHATGDWLKPGDYWSPPGTKEAEVDQQYYRAALQFMRSHPGRTAWLAVRKLWIFWTPYPHPSDQLPFLFLLPLVWVGLVVSMQSRRTWILLLTIAYFTLVSCVFFANQRFHVPLLPLLALYAGVGGERLVAWVAQRSGNLCMVRR